MSRLRRSGRHVTIALISLSLANTEPARGQMATDTLRGTVLDSAGTRLNALVRLSGAGQPRSTYAQDGRFQFVGLAPGPYQLRAAMIGHEPKDTGVIVTPGRAMDVTIVSRAIPMRLETLPPRNPRPASADTVPKEAETIDRVARAADLPLLRPNPPRAQGKELRIWIGFGMGIPMSLVRFTVQGGRIQGEEILWVNEPLRTSDVDSSWEKFMHEMPAWMRERCGGGRVAVDTTAYANFKNVTSVCRKRFESEPDWPALLVELESHDVWSLPDDSELPRLGGKNFEIVSIDGAEMIVEAWDGARYHTYSYGNPDTQPAPEAKHATAIMYRLIKLGPPKRLSSH